MQDEGLTGAQMPKPSACNDDSAIAVATFCWTTVRARPRRPPTREKAPLFVRWRDHDPSRIALLHDNGDFGRRAWRDHVESPDSAAELPFDCRGGLLQRDNYDGRLPTIKLAKSGSRRVARRELP